MYAGLGFGIRILPRLGNSESSNIASTYGAAGSLIVLLLWVYYSVQVFLLGAELTKAFANRHGSKQDKPTGVLALKDVPAPSVG